MRKADRVGIIGLGYVGGAVRNWFENKKKSKPALFFYDKFKNIGSVEEVNVADFIFVCVPTPYHEDGRGYDDSAVVDALSNIKKSKTAIIKSTVVPGSTEKYQKMFPYLRILFNPEFLVAKTANDDFLKPDRQIVGYTPKSLSRAKQALKLLPKAHFTKIVPAAEAEMAKYFCNTFLSARVVFANQIYDVCEKMGINYEAVKEMAGADPRIGKSHFDIFHDGYRGYGGLCLPKDTKAFIDFVSEAGLKPKLHKALEEINEELRKKH